MPKPTPKKPTHTAKQYEEMGRLLESIYETNYANRWRMYRVAFGKGVLAGLGGVLGATVVVGLLLWVLSLVEHIPFVPDVSQKLEQSLEQRQ